MKPRGGYTLAEALVALLLLALLLQVAWTATAVHGRAAFTVFERAKMLEAARISGWVLRSELGVGVRGVDWEAGDDTVSLRAFRGLGVTCGPASEPGGLAVRSTLMRALDPAKDSVLVLWPDGYWRTHALIRGSVGPACVEGESPTEVWAIDPPVAGGLLVRVFERGAYHLSDSAFRYRRGAGGRQPLTPRTLSRSSSLDPAGSAVRLDLEPARDPTPGWRSEQVLWLTSR